MNLKSFEEYLDAPFGINKFEAIEFEELRSYLNERDNLNQVIKNFFKTLKEGNDHISLQTIRDGHEFHLDQIVLANEIIQSKDPFDVLDKQKCSIKLAGLQNSCKEIKSFSNQMYKKYGFALFSNMYITPEGDNNCYTYHVDPHKVFFIHLKGEKNWFFPKEDNQSAFFPEVFDVNENQEYKEVENKLIKQNDSFAISKGIVHKAENVGNETAVHITFPMAQTDQFLLLKSLVNSFMKKFMNEIENNQPDQEPEEVRKMLLNLLDDLDSKNEFMKFKTNYMFRNLYNAKLGRPYAKNVKDRYENIFFK